MFSGKDHVWGITEKRQTTTDVGKGVEKGEPSYTAGGNVS